MNLPNEILNKVFSYIESPTNSSIKEGYNEYLSKLPDNIDFLKIHKLKHFSKLPFDYFINDIKLARENRVRNGPFDVGSRDYYYYRKPTPNFISNRILNVNTNRYEDQYILKNDMTTEEIKYYYYGYYYQKFILQDRKI
jgi:hypothetical protein